MPDKHQWQHRYLAPLASGQTIPDIMPGGLIARCLMEIQDVVADLKSDSNFAWTYPVRMPDGRTINTARPGLYYARAIREIQDTLDNLSGAVSAAMVQSYSEHRQVLGQSAYEYDATPGSGGDWINRVPIPMPNQIIHISRPGLQIAQAITEIQNYIDAIEIDPDLELEMQTWLETYCTSFIDHVSGPINEDGDAFLYFTLSTWRAAAGIDGSWLPGDLEKGFNALLWTKQNSTWTENNQTNANGYSSADCETAKSNHDLQWRAIWLESGNGIQAYAWAGYFETYPGTEWQFISNLYRSKTSLINGIGLNRSAEIYAYFLPLSGGTEFNDLYGDGYQENKLCKIADVTESSETQETEWLNDKELSCVDAAGYSCPISLGNTFTSGFQCVRDKNSGTRGCQWLLKWNFTTA